MLNNIRSEAEKAMRFAKKHQTIVACAATAAVTYKYTHTRTLNGALEGCSAVLYEAGRENGVLAVQNGVLREFIGHKGLNTELVEFVQNLKVQD